MEKSSGGQPGIGFLMFFLWMSEMAAGILALKKKKGIYFDAQVCISFFGGK